MISRAVEYLLRFDDLCPTMSRTGWERFAVLIEEFELQPILAVVPDNRDSELILENADLDFWGRMRALEADGAAIALHGYQHLCCSKGRGLLQLHKRTEFAGIAGEVQREWIHEGLKFLRGHGLNPRLFVAPRHGFDRATLRALRNEGMGYLSDGFARVPFRRDGIVWIPQQLWGPEEKSHGLWTVCIHSNTAGDDLAKVLRIFLERHAAQFTSLDRVMVEYRPDALELTERIYETIALGRLRASRFRQHIAHRR